MTNSVLLSETVEKKGELFVSKRIKKINENSK